MSGHRFCTKLWVELIVYDVLVNETATLIIEETDTGTYEVEFNATAFRSGIYFYRLQVGDCFVEIMKIMLMKQDHKND